MRAQGANVIVASADNTGAYGAVLASDFVLTPVAGEISLGEGQDWIPSDLIGLGREPQLGDRGVITNGGRARFPVDVRNSGMHFKRLLGAPATNAGVQAIGHIAFSAQPGNDTTITINGTAFTFKASGATGAQINKGSTLAATLENAVSVLNASADSAVDDATYSLNAKKDRIVVRHDSLGTSGNSFTLAAGAGSNATVSAATLAGGSASGGYHHRFTSGGLTLPDCNFEIGHPDTVPPLYHMNYGVMYEMLELRMQRSGLLNMDINLVAQGENEPTGSTGAGTPSERTFERFSQFFGEVVDDETGVYLADVQSARLQYSNGLMPVDCLRADGRVSGFDVGQVGCGLEAELYFSSSAMDARARAGTAVSLRAGWEISNTKRLAITFHRLNLTRPSKGVSNAGAIMRSFRMIGSEHPTLAKSMTIDLWNDVASY